MKFGVAHHLIQKIIKFKSERMPLEALYSLINLQDMFVKNSMFMELDRKQQELRIRLLEESKGKSEQEQALVLKSVNDELYELSDIEIQLDKEPSLTLVVDPNSSFVTLEDVNVLRDILGENFVLKNKENNLSVVL